MDLNLGENIGAQGSSKEGQGAYMEILGDRKTGHWAWWAWPTEKRGNNELNDKDRLGNPATDKQKTCVDAKTARQLLNDPPDSWKKLLTLIDTNLKKYGNSQYAENLISTEADRDRIKYFIKFWEKIIKLPEHGPPGPYDKWLQGILDTYKKYYELDIPGKGGKKLLFRTRLSKKQKNNTQKTNLKRKLNQLKPQSAKNKKQKKRENRKERLKKRRKPKIMEIKIKSS